MRREADLDQRVARLAAEGRLRALALQPDRLAVLDIGRQLDGDLAAVGKLRGDLGGGDHVLEADVHGDVEVGRRRHAAAAAALLAEARALPGARRSLLESVAEDLAEDVVGVEAGGAELEMAGARPAALLAAEAGERVAAAGARPELLESRLARGVDLAAVEGLALLLVAEDLVGLVGLRKALLGLRIVRVLVRMKLLGQLAEGRLYVLVRGRLGNAQHVVGITHGFSLPRGCGMGSILYESR